MKALITFKPSGNYGPQYITPVINPNPHPTVHQVEQGWLEVMRGGTFYTNHDQAAQIEGGWDAKRFGFVLETDDPRKHGEHKTFLFGYTEPCEEVTDDTKLHFSRLTEVHIAKCRTKDGEKNFSRNVRDLLIFPKETPRPLDESKYNAKVKTVFLRISCNMAFGQHLRADARDGMVMNTTGTMRHYNCKSAPVADMTGEGWVAAAVIALLKSKRHSFADFMDEGNEEIFSLAGDMLENSNLEHVEVWDEMTAKSNLGFDGYITMGELKAIMEDPTRVIVNSRIPSDVQMGGETAEARALFDFFVKQAVVEAKYNGLGFYTKKWERRGGEVVQTVEVGEPLVRSAVWDDREDLHSLEEGLFTNPERIALPSSSIPVLAEGDDWSVSIRLDVTGDITGYVRHGADGETSIFVRPAWAVAMTSGLLVDQLAIDNIANTVQLLHSERDRIMEHKARE